MIIRVDNCSTFEIRKSSTASILPKFFLNQVIVRTVDIGKSIEYFNFSMDKIDHMSAVLQLVTDLMSKLDESPCQLKSKLLLYHRFVLSK